MKCGGDVEVQDLDDVAMPTIEGGSDENRFQKQSRCVWGPFKSPAQDMKKGPGAGSKILARNVFTVSLGFLCSRVPTCWGH